MKPKTTMPTPLRITNQTTESTSELREQIRRRAYELYEQLGETMAANWTTGYKQSQR